MREDRLMRHPNRVAFYCQGCRQNYVSTYIRRLNGHCVACKNDTWAIVMLYRDAETTPLGITGVTTTTGAIECVLPNVPRDTLLYLISDLNDIGERVASYCGARNLQDSLAGGAE